MSLSNIKYTNIDENINIMKDVYIRNNLNILGSLSIHNQLRVNNIKGFKKVTIGNCCFIEENLILQKDLKWLRNPKYPMLLLKQENIIENTNIIRNNIKSYISNLIVDKSINSYFNCSFNNINSTEMNISSYSNQYTYNSNLLVGNAINSDYTIRSNNNILDYCFQTKNLVVMRNSICGNINTNNFIVNNNVNSSTDYKLNIKNEIVVKNNSNFDSDIIVFNNCNIYKLEHITNENYVVLPNNNLKFDEPNSLTFNPNKKTIEAYYDNKWRSISHLFNCDYNTYIDLNKNINLYQNNKLTLESNSNSITINKNVTNIFNNLNIESGVFNNITIYKNLNQYNNFINSSTISIPMNSKTVGKKKQLRYNNINKLIEYYSDIWQPIQINYLHIVNNTNTLHILANNNNKISINSNTIQFYNNMNIEQNVNIDNLYISKNININKDMIFNNKIKLKNNNNTLDCFSSSNYNNSDFKLLKLDETLSNNSFYYNYDSHYIYLLANYDNLQYCSNEYNMNDNLIVDRHNYFIYHIFSTNDIFINEMNFEYFINNTNINNYLNISNLKNLKNHFHIIIYLSNTKVIYDSESNITLFKLEKNNYYTIKLKIKNINNNPNKTNTFILFKLRGYYYNNFLFDNKDIEFLYNVDLSFFNNINFSNINTNKIINFNENLNCDTIKNIKNIYINKSKFDSINSILKVNEVNHDSILNITNNSNIFFGNTNIIINNCNFIVKNKFNNDSLYVLGNTTFNKNTYINNDLNIINNCTISNKYDFKSVKLNKILVDNINFNNTITCNNLNINNIYLNYNQTKNNFNNFIITNIISNNKSYNFDNLINHNITINNKYINYNNKLYVNYDGNLNINSNESFNTFSVGNKLNPNISISFNGDTNINTSEFYLNNINIIKELNILKSNI